MSTSEPKRIFVSCAPGLEPYLARECFQIGINLPKSTERYASDASFHGPDEEKGGIEFMGFDRHVYLCNLHLRTASRVVVRLGEFNAVSFPELRKKASRLEWQEYIKPGQDVVIKVTCHKSKLIHSDAVAERVRGAIEDHFAQPIMGTKAENKQIVLVRLVNDQCTISIDSSSELLHRRGYRQAVAKAPLRETLAAGLLLSAGWDAKSPLVDPFCGSGTIPIEAALMNRRIAPGLVRHFAFMDWAEYQPDVFKALLDDARQKITPVTTMLYGSDRDRGAIEMATANAARTDVNKDIRFACHAVSDLPSFEQPGWIVTNPPYGVRISPTKDLRDLYAAFGRLYRERFPVWKLALLCNDPALIAALDLGTPAHSLALTNGGLPVKLSIFLP
jgi:putative N6-adenine-specific DNA methylase